VASSNIEKAATPGPRLAVVIGNSSYEEMAALVNPENDAQDMTRALRGMGFSVTLLTNSELMAMEDAVVDLGKRLSAHPASIGLFFSRGMVYSPKEKII